LLRVASARISAALPIIDKDTAPPISAMEASMMPEAFGSRGSFVIRMNDGRGIFSFWVPKVLVNTQAIKHPEFDPLGVDLESTLRTVGINLVVMYVAFRLYWTLSL
jgi:hypothetical protein